jgi:hypothetical protein
VRIKRVLIAMMTLCAACASAYSEAPVVAAIGSRTLANPMRATIEVELDIFSGRPNPTWTLTDAESDIIAERLAALPPAAPRKLSANLGYRGFIATIRQPGGEATARIQKGFAEITSGARTTYHEDRHRELERWLIGTGKAYVPTDIQQIVQRSFE